MRLVPRCPGAVARIDRARAADRADRAGTTVYNGLNYYTRNEYETLVLNTNMLITISTVAQTANFGGGDINGQVMQVQVVPEPSTYALLGLSAAAFGAYQWRRRRRG